jgi:hypothetical protein
MRLKIQANATKKHDTGEEGYLVTAWSHHVDPPQCVMSEWVSESEASELVRGLTPAPHPTATAPSP